MNKNQTIKKLTACICAAAVAALSCVAVSFAAEKEDVLEELSDTSLYLLEQNSSADYTNDYVLGAVVSGAVDESFCKSYKESVEAALLENGGKLMYTDYYSGEQTESLMYEATAAIVLNKMGYDTSDIGGYNFADILSSYDLSLVSNPYYLCEALKAARAINAGDELEQKLLEALMAYYTVDDSDSTLGGMNYWGISTDNNGVFIEAVAPYMSENEEVKEAVEKSLNFILSMKRDDGYDSSVTYASEYGNPDSTALALRAFVACGDDENAADAYSLLLGFKSSQTTGAYLYYGSDNVYATKDAQSALLAYYEYLTSSSEEETTESTETTEEATEAGETTTEATTTDSDDESESTTAEDTGAEETTTTTTSTTESSTASTSTDSNPNTGAAGITATVTMLAFAGVIALKKRR
ncbi:MAG: hypothetical protein LIO41_00770 [Ruminococcus sp.]|nr:hypothetical protein [Ruminococcus sp.]